MITTIVIAIFVLNALIMVDAVVARKPVVALISFLFVVYAVSVGVIK